MDFALTANQNGPSDPFNITLRGADPLYSLRFPCGNLHTWKTGGVLTTVQEKKIKKKEEKERKEEKGETPIP